MHWPTYWLLMPWRQSSMPAQLWLQYHMNNTTQYSYWGVGRPLLLSGVAFSERQCTRSYPWFMGPTWTHLGPTGPRWAPCRPHEPCFLGWVYGCMSGMWHLRVPMVSGQGVWPPHGCHQTPGQGRVCPLMPAVNMSAIYAKMIGSINNELTSCFNWYNVSDQERSLFDASENSYQYRTVLSLNRNSIPEKTTFICDLYI